MGTTLENGVYLPSEGERNCYAGLKTNWEILDQKVADVTALQQAVAGALHRQIVASLPTTDIDPNTIYMVLSGTSATENVYNEFMYVNNAWELIGTSATDLTNYYTKAEVDGKLLLKASASDLTSHTGDTTIHVTTADKNRWNNQTYVFRYSSTALVASSTNSNTLLDNTDNLKVGDKVIDSSGVLFSITAIDTANSTFTIGTALIDLAQDSDVVHKSGNETVGGEKTFTNRPIIFNSNATVQADVPNLMFKNPLVERASTTLEGEQTILFTDKNDKNIASIQAKTYTSGQISDLILTSYSETSDQSVKTTSVVIRRTPTTSKFHGYSDNITSLGETNRRWSRVYAMNYYYGNDNVEFSTKFVTTDTAQTVSGTKTFDSNTYIYNSDNTATTPVLILKNSKVSKGSSSETGTQMVRFYDKGDALVGELENVVGNKQTALRYRVSTLDSNNQPLSIYVTLIVSSTGSKLFCPGEDNGISLGGSTLRWSKIYGTEYYYGSNNVEFSQKFVTTDTNQTISGNKTFSSINGVEPSSLSLPNIDNRIDISSYITNLSNVGNEYTPPVNGWICIRSGNATKISVLDVATSVGNASISNTATYLTVMTPVVANRKVYITVICTSLDHAYFIPCQGNV